MSYRSLLKEDYSIGGSNKEAAKKLFDSLLGKEYAAYVNIERNASEFKDVTRETVKDDYLTMENLIADPNTGKPISSVLSMKTIINQCQKLHPTVDADGTKLSNIQRAMAIPTNDIIESSEEVKKVGDGKAELFMRNQMLFGFDAVTEILKNCCASHTVIHSILKGALMVLYDKIKEWGPQQLETPGQEMTLCTTIECIQKICDLVKEAKESTTRKITKSNLSRCGRCKAKGHGTSTIITPFIDLVNARYDDSTSSAIDVQNYNLPPEFLVKGGKQSRYPRLTIDDLRCSFTSSSNISSMNENWANGRIKQKVKRARLDTSISKFIKSVPQVVRSPPPSPGTSQEGSTRGMPSMPQVVRSPPSLPGTSQEGSTRGMPSMPQVVRSFPSPSSLPETSQEGSNRGMSSPSVGPMDYTLAPTAEQVQETASESLAMESRGQTSGLEWVKIRDEANSKSIGAYASKGSGINTGRYRSFNPTL